jgi:hypothetical protein
MSTQKKDGPPAVPGNRQARPPVVADVVYHNQEDLSRWTVAQQEMTLATAYDLLQQIQLGQNGHFYPAILVLGRATEQSPLVFVDGRILDNQQALESRLYTYLALEQAGAVPYQFAIAPLARALDVVQAAREQLDDYHDYLDTKLAAQRGVL